MTARNPQAAQMADESMVRTLAAQVRCIWPQERRLLARYGSPRVVVDVGCGTGEFTARLADHYPAARIIGVELEPAHVRRAAARCSGFGDRVVIQQGDAFALSLPAQSADLVVCRHVLQAVPEPEAIVAECLRILRPGGWVHLLVEDYTMIHIEGSPDLDRFWLDGPVRFGEDTGCDLRIGRRGLALIEPCRDRRLDYVVVDTVRVPREDFAAVFMAWRDGYSEVLGPYLERTTGQVDAIFDEMIATIRGGYAVWQVPIVSGQLTGLPRGERIA